MFNFNLYLLAYGKIYANQGAMTPGASAETADGMSEDKIHKIIEAVRSERYRFSPAEIKDQLARFPARRTRARTQPGQDADHPRPHPGGPVPRLRDHRLARRPEDHQRPPYRDAARL